MVGTIKDSGNVINDAYVKGLEAGAIASIKNLNALIKSKEISVCEYLGPLDPDVVCPIEEFRVMFDWNKTTDDLLAGDPDWLRLTRFWKFD